MPDTETQDYTLGIATAEEVDNILQKSVQMHIDDEDDEMLVFECYNPN